MEVQTIKYSNFYELQVVLQHVYFHFDFKL